MNSRQRPTPLSLANSVGDKTDQSSHLSQSLQAQYKPNFLQSHPNSDIPGNTAPLRKQDGIMQRFERTHGDMIETLHLGKGPLTEKQLHDHNWGKREDPRAARDQMLLNQQTYAAQQKLAKSAPSHPTNFHGPSKRFGT